MKDKTKKIILLRISFVVLISLAIALYYFLQKNSGNTLKINEIGFSLADGIDWIEIYNPTMNNLSLENLYLSDNNKDFSKFKIKQEIIVPANSFIVIYCDEYEGDTTNTVVTNFRISKGETIYLVAEDGRTIVDSLSAITDNSDVTEISIGRYPDGSEEIFIMSEYTPGQANQKGLYIN